jgi:hypothetical protein
MKDKEKFKNQLRAAVRDYSPVEHGYSKSDMLKFFKFQLPEINESFLDHFTDLVGDIRTRQVGDWVEKAMGVWGAVQKAEKRGAEQALASMASAPPETTAPEAQPQEPKMYHPRPEAANPLEVPPKTKASRSLTARGELLSQKLSTPTTPLKLYDYGQDEHFLNVLNADSPSLSPMLDPERREKIVNYVHKPWQRAMSSWLVLNKMASQGQLPSSVIAHAAIFAAMSPNTSVPMQELYYGHYMDFRAKHGDVFSKPEGIKPEDAEHFHRWLNKTTPPEFFRDFYVGRTQEKGGIEYDASRTKRRAGYDPATSGAVLADRPQGRPLLNYHRFHPFMVALQREVKDDGRAFVDYIMQKKQSEGADSFMYGFGPKLARYMGLMMGQGNMIIPDRHQLRALFNISDKNSEQAKQVFNALTPVRGETLLRGIDHHFFQKAPAVQKVHEMWPDHFKGREMQAVGPAFWLQWLAYPHYEALLGRDTDNFNMGTAHDPFFKSVGQIMDEEGIPHDLTDPSKMWNMQKSQDQYGEPLTVRIAKATKRVEKDFGEGPASFFFYTWGAPALMTNDRTRSYDETSIRKMEAFEVEARRLFKSGSNLLKGTLPAQPEEEWPPTSQPTIIHKDQKIKPGSATIYFNKDGTRAEGGRKMAIVGTAPAHPDAPVGEWLMVPHEHLGSFSPEHMERWGIDGSAEVHSEPEFLDMPPGVVDADRHVPSNLIINDYQRQMVHGFDHNAAAQFSPEHFKSGISEGRWVKLPNGKQAFIKTLSTQRDGRSSALNEIMFHNMMHHLGLGEHVAPTSIFQNPNLKTNEEPRPNDWWSVHEAIPNAAHQRDGDEEQNSAFVKNIQNGKLHKLALADQMLGARDRHLNNFMFGGAKGDNIYLIDHGDSFPSRGVGDDRSDYMVPAQEAAKAAGHNDNRLHPDARKWLMGIDKDKFTKEIQDHDVPVSVARAARQRLENLQHYASVEPDASVDEITSYLGFANSGWTGMHAPQIRERAYKDFSVLARHAERVKEVKARIQNLPEAEQDYDLASLAVSKDHESASRKGEAPVPYELLMSNRGPGEAENIIKKFAHHADMTFDEAVTEFNNSIRRRGNSERREAHRNRDEGANRLARGISKGADPAGYLNSLGYSLDALSRQWHGPERGDGETDQDFQKRILDYMEPHIHKHMGKYIKG